jgi:hypothetical protein
LLGQGLKEFDLFQPLQNFQNQEILLVTCQRISPAKESETTIILNGVSSIAWV